MTFFDFSCLLKIENCVLWGVFQRRISAAIFWPCTKPIKELAYCRPKEPPPFSGSSLPRSTCSRPSFAWAARGTPAT